MRFVYLYIVLFFANHLAAQTPSYYQYETSNGLPSNEIYDIKQDQQGFLWLGTDAGLVRYDGTRFKIYNNNQSRGNAVSGLHEDKFGRMWCSNFSGQIFYIIADTLALFTPFEKLYKTHYAELDFDIDGNVIVTCGVNKLYKFNIQNFSLEILNLEEKSTAIFPAKTYNNQFLISNLTNPAQLFLLQKNSFKKIDFLLQNNQIQSNFIGRFILSNSYLNKQTLCFQQFNPGNPLPLLFYYSNSKMLFHPATNILQQLNAYPQFVYDDDDGNLFIGTTKELLWLKKDAHKNWYLFTKMFVGNSISCIRKDKEQNVWISTLKNGIYKIPNTQIFSLNLEQIKAKSIGVNNLTTNNKNSIYGSSLSGEVFDYNITNKKITIYNSPEDRDVQALKYNDYNNELFICKTQSFILNTINKTVSKSSTYFINSKDLAFTKDEVIYKASDVLEVLIKKKNKASIQQIINNYDTVHKNYYFNIAADIDYKKFVLNEKRCNTICFISNTKTLWVGSNNGLRYIKNKKMFSLLDPQTNKPIIATQFIYDSINQQLFVSTIKQGLFIIKNEKIINQLNISNGLNSNNVKRCRIYKNNIWLIGNSKIQSYNLQTMQTKTIDMQDGLLSNELYDVEVLNDTVYVASSKGVQYFPTNISTNNAVAPTSLIQYFIADDSVYNVAKPIELNPATKNIEINLLGIALKSNGNLKYQYRLLPVDSNWITISSQENMVRYSSLSSNQYTFQSRVLNEDNVVSKNISEVKFVVIKPWYLQWWFFATTLFVSMFSVYIIYQFRYKKNQLKLKQELDKSKTEEELRRSQLSSLKSQMNPHFMFNALNSIQEFIILNNKEQANMYMGKFADLMRLTLDMSNKDEVALEEELKALNLYLELEALRFEEKFTYHIYLENSVNTAIIYLPPMLIQPYVENAIKHGLLHKKENKILEIRFAIHQNNILNCSIKDNGIGRKRSMEINALRKQKHTSFATGATQKRLELLNAQTQANIVVAYNDLVDNNSNSLGTEVCVNIPLN